MAGPFRRLLIASALAAASGPAAGPPSAFGGQAPAPAPGQVPSGDGAKLAPGDFALPGEDPPRAFVPARPRSVEDQKHVESLRYFAAARAQEDDRKFADAIKTLEKALASEPTSVPVLRRLSSLNFALGREEPAIAYSRRVFAVDPGDIETVALLINHYKDDQAAAEALLTEVASNPKLDKNSVGALYVDYELGNLYEATLRMDKAATAFAKVVDALDDKTNARIKPSDLKRFLGNDEAQAYLRFGRVFKQANKVDLAINAFRRGLVYEPDDPLLLLYLSQTYQEAGRAEEALACVERFIRRQPRGRETYDLLAKILTSLKREAEIIPRLEKYAQADPKNAPLQYALADRYKAAGQVVKAAAIYNTILAEQRDTQDFAELFPKLVKERKTEDLLILLAKVTAKLRRLDPVRPQLEELIKDPGYTDEVLDVGLKMISASPPALDPRDGWAVLFNLATEAKRPEKTVALLRWSVKQMPNPLVYRELINTLAELEKYDEAEAAFRDLVDKFPDEKNARNQIMLADILSRAGKNDDAVAIVHDLIKQEPNDPELTRSFSILLSRAGKLDEAVDTLRNYLKVDVANPDLNALLGSFLMQGGKNDEAIALFKALIERYPNNEDLVKLARSTLSVVYTNMGDFAKGEAELEILFAKNPDDVGVNNDLGYLYADQGKNLEKAEGMIRKALSEDPDNNAYLDSLGWVLFKRGKVQEARIPLEKAAIDPRGDATIQEHLGDVYFQLQEYAKAKGTWEKALKIAAGSKPPDRRLAEIRKKLDALGKFEPSPLPAKGDKP